MQIESRPVANVKYSALDWVLIIVPFTWLWFHLIDNLRLQWTTDPQYSYGLVVPLLTAGLLLRRWQRFSADPIRSGGFPTSLWVTVLAVFLIVFYFPIRLLEEAVPEWRPIGWLLAIETIVLTLYGIYLLKGRAGLVRYAFPICFFLTAVPWPTLFEQPIIQSLSRINAAMVVNVLSIIGVPAIQHGNIIEVSTGLVGINDACSGIRSLQSSLMISLFLGEFYLMKWPRRCFLVLAGFAVAMFFNICRTSILTYIAAKKGIDAVAKYHDETGMTVLLACTATLWGVSYLASIFPKRSPGSQPHVDNSSRQDSGLQNFQAARFLSITLIVWVGLVEAGVQLWYHVRESKIDPGPSWSLVLPEDNATFKPLPDTPEEHTLLRFDDGKQGQWQAADGTFWQAYYFDWLPGRVAGYLAKRHTPDVCLPAVGLTMTSGPALTILDVNGLKLPFRSYVFTGPGTTLQVFQCHWEPGIKDETYANESSRFNLIRGIWAGRGNKGQKVIEIVMTGYKNSDDAREALASELQKMIKVEKTQARLNP
ncbi:MAG TPA: exosortase/archaeosortase family protein [Pseudomonadales bacterium]|nr:exosortase/archaeosortase family protein [Pseudomonadales bacterium]